MRACPTSPSHSPHAMSPPPPTPSRIAVSFTTDSHHHPYNTSATPFTPLRVRCLVSTVRRLTPQSRSAVQSRLLRALLMIAVLVSNLLAVGVSVVDSIFLTPLIKLPILFTHPTITHRHIVAPYNFFAPSMTVILEKPVTPPTIRPRAVPLSGTPLHNIITCTNPSRCHLAGRPLFPLYLHHSMLAPASTRAHPRSAPVHLISVRASIPYHPPCRPLPSALPSLTSSQPAARPTASGAGAGVGT